MNVAGEWYGVWGKHDEPLSRREEFSIRLVCESETITGSFSWGDAEYRLSCRLVSGIFLTGTYEDRRGGRSFVGAFQLALHPAQTTMAGKWIGFDMRNRVQSGSWHWRRPGVKYSFEMRGNSYFLSYAHEQASIADHLEVLLRRRHCVVLRDESRIRPAASLSREVASAIASVDTFVALHSQDYSKSEWCTGELEHARQLKMKERVPRRIVLVDLDGTPVPPPFMNLLVLNGCDRIARERAISNLYEDTE
ncbi:MAG TPA: toll/interleukin-1 receptor domain-containing protein [Longimicrobiaceae bacterium]|nr:toll/interleukin-1 receptor domain-containing protein [Longimicrobiaceae bacterium]